MTEPSCHSRLSSRQLTRHPINDWFDHAVFRRMCSCEARARVNRGGHGGGKGRRQALGTREARAHDAAAAAEVEAQAVREQTRERRRMIGFRRNSAFQHEAPRETMLALTMKT